ncbi:hypothetical protein [Paenibacillus humicus]|uniref:hypothetical protein n=1 Tax=Paenibacillus humicus TaxID=412861 RepID=UPI003F18BF6C
MRSRPAILFRPVPLLAGLTAAGLLLAGCGTKALPSGGEPSSVSAGIGEAAKAPAGADIGEANGPNEALPASEPDEGYGDEGAPAASQAAPKTDTAAGSADLSSTSGETEQAQNSEAGSAAGDSVDAAAGTAAAGGKAGQAPEGGQSGSVKPASGANAAASPAPGTANAAANAKPQRTASPQAGKPSGGTAASGSKAAADASPAPQASAGPKASLPGSSASPLPSPASSAPPTVRSSLDGPETIRFSELYGKETVRGLTFSDKLKELDGQKVEMIGYMAPPLTATVRFFVLTRIPLAICPFCSSDADWPSDIVVVNLPKGSEMTPTEHQVKITGTLSVGSMTDEETGFVSLIRINADKTEVLK